MDFFRPRVDTARTIYDAFQVEAAKRPGRALDVWLKAERQAVWVAARDAAQAMGLRTPTMAEVASAERYACGSIDYGKTWAHQVVAAMRRAQPLASTMVMAACCAVPTGLGRLFFYTFSKEL